MSYAKEQEELSTRFFEQQDEAILEGLKDILAKGKLILEFHPIATTHLYQDGEAKIRMEQKLRMTVPKHPPCTTCKHQESRGMGYCNVLQQRTPKNFYCATHSVEKEKKPYSEE